MQNIIERYFTTCCVCGKPIYIGKHYYKVEGLCGLYCSAECFTAAQATESFLTFDECDNCCVKVYKDTFQQVIKEERVDKPVAISQEELARLASEESAKQ